MKSKRVKSMEDIIVSHDPYIKRNKWEYDAIHGALKPLDALSASLEVKWGRDRLITFVSPETASKFDTARAKLDASIAYHDATDVVKRASIMMRGWNALENEALANGHKPFPADVWIACVGEEGNNPEAQYAIVQDSASASMVKMEGINTYSLIEVARIIRLFEGHVGQASNIKKLFPDAVVKAVTFNDDIPF
jgi:hypothetical protein